jgi:hypothetical protein
VPSWWPQRGRPQSVSAHTYTAHTRTHPRTQLPPCSKTQEGIGRVSLSPVHEPRVPVPPPSTHKRPYMSYVCYRHIYTCLYVVFACASLPVRAAGVKRQAKKVRHDSTLNVRLPLAQDVILPFVCVCVFLVCLSCHQTQGSPESSTTVGAKHDKVTQTRMPSTHPQAYTHKPSSRPTHIHGSPPG